MSLLPHQIELLSPARDADIGIAAVNHGADAVYIGGPAFGARAGAGNDIRDLERLIAHAHRFHSRVFITLNTILRDDELEGARQMAWQVYNAGADALIIQDMGLLELDLPPIQLHASTQTDIRTPEKARFLQDCGLSQIVLARELTVQQIAAVRAAIDPQRCAIEFFIHGALCVAYSGQCYISHAQTGRSANRGDCSQTCRLPYQVTDAQGRIVAHDKHVLSMKDNNQSDNLRALIDAGVRSFKIEGRYKDMGYVKNITAHYRTLLDEILDEREASGDPLVRASSGRTTFGFTPDPLQNFNREFTDYFVNGRQEDIGAFDTPKNPGQAVGWVTKLGPNFAELEVSNPATVLHNGDGLCYYDLQKELVGLQINRAEPVSPRGGRHWRVFPKDPMEGFKDLRKGTEVNRNRDMDWVRTLEKKSSDRRIALWAQFSETADGFALTLTDEDGFTGSSPGRPAPRGGAGCHQGRGPACASSSDASAPASSPCTTSRCSSRSPGSSPPPASTRCAAMPSPVLEAARAAPIRAPAARHARRAARALPRGHALLPGQRVQPQGARLLRTPRREGDRRGLRKPRRGRRGQPDGHQALRALFDEPVPQASQGRYRCTGHDPGRTLDADQRQRAPDLAL
jgi:collagenase-like PrtC family protease